MGAYGPHHHARPEFTPYYEKKHTIKNQGENHGGIPRG